MVPYIVIQDLLLLLKSRDENIMWLVITPNQTCTRLMSNTNKIIFILNDEWIQVSWKDYQVLLPWVIRRVANRRRKKNTGNEPHSVISKERMKRYFYMGIATSFSIEAPVWSLSDTNKGNNRQEEMQLVPIVRPTFSWRKHPVIITHIFPTKFQALDVSLFEYKL